MPAGATEIPEQRQPKVASLPPAQPVASPSPATTRPLYVVLTGNPNCGKTTVFNALTGLRAKVGNYAGVTVERKEGRLPGAPARMDVRVLDLPGTYSLSPNSLDEQISRDVLLHRLPELPAPDLIVIVVDASNLQRNLYYTTQVIELGHPTLIALNMVDVAEANGHRIDSEKLGNTLGVPVLPVVASAGQGVAGLKQKIIALLAGVAGSATDPPGDLPTAKLFCQLPGLFRIEATGLAALLAQTFQERRLQATAEALLLLSNERALASSRGHYPQNIQVARYAEVPVPDAEKLEKFFTKHKAKYPRADSPEPGFRVPKRIAVQYFEADPEKLADPKAITAAEIEAEYQTERTATSKRQTPCHRGGDRDEENRAGEEDRAQTKKTEPAKKTEPQTNPGAEKEARRTRAEPRRRPAKGAQGGGQASRHESQERPRGQIAPQGNRPTRRNRPRRHRRWAFALPWPHLPPEAKPADNNKADRGEEARREGSLPEEKKPGEEPKSRRRCAGQAGGNEEVEPVEAKKPSRRKRRNRRRPRPRKGPRSG